MTDLQKLEESRPELVDVLKQYTHEELLENYATEVLEKDEKEANHKLNENDFGWLSARIQDFVKKMYGEEHSALISEEKAVIICNVQTYL
jgi:hypothetical protein